jgi:hypothetical protein
MAHLHAPKKSAGRSRSAGRDEADHPVGGVSRFLALQRYAGNQAVSRMIAESTVDVADQPSVGSTVKMSLYGNSKESAAAEHVGNQYIVGSPGEQFTGWLETVDEREHHGEAGFLQKLVDNSVTGYYGTDLSGPLTNYDEANDPPYKDTVNSDGAWTFADDTPRAVSVEPGRDADVVDFDRPVATFDAVRDGRPFQKFDLLLDFKTAFLFREESGAWRQVSGSWHWFAEGTAAQIAANEVKQELSDIELSEEQDAAAWDPETIRALPHANTAVNQHE